MAESGEFNTRFRAHVLIVAFAILGLRVAAGADEIRKWKDADGKQHYSVTGSEGATGEVPSNESPVVRGREMGKDETFSVDASLRRREIENKLRAAGRELEKVRTDLAATEGKTLNAWVPTVTRNPAAAQASLDAQRDAFLAVGQFEQEKADTLRRLRRQERAKLREIVGYWKEFATLDAAVTERYGKAPDWWRARLDCGCPTLADAEIALRGPKTEPTPGPTPEDEGWEEDDWE